MNTLSLLFCVTSAFAAPQYNYQNLGGSNITPFPSPNSLCSSCGKPEINIYSFDAPFIPKSPPLPRSIPQPKIRHNIVFVKTPEDTQQEEPIIIPQNQEKTLVYVLNKNEQVVPAPVQFEETAPLKPEVFYVHYEEGQNVELPGGYDLQSALASANSQQGELINGLGIVSESVGAFDESFSGGRASVSTFGGASSSFGGESGSFGAAESSFNANSGSGQSGNFGSSTGSAGNIGGFLGGGIGGFQGSVPVSSPISPSNIYEGPE